MKRFRMLKVLIVFVTCLPANTIHSVAQETMISFGKSETLYKALSMAKDKELPLLLEECQYRSLIHGMWKKIC